MGMKSSYLQKWVISVRTQTWVSFFSIDVIGMSLHAPDTVSCHMIDMLKVASSSSTLPRSAELPSTIWRTVADQKSRIYFFESTMAPNIFWVEFDNIGFSPRAPVKKLPIRSDIFNAGDAAHLFREAEPFVFMGALP